MSVGHIVEHLAVRVPTRAPNARSTAALLDNPGCQRRTLLDAAGLDLSAIAEQAGAPQPFGMSPFALGQGIRFERTVLNPDDQYATMRQLLADTGLWDMNDTFRYVSIADITSSEHDDIRAARADTTTRILADILTAGDAALIEHAVTSFDLNGNLVYLEQDALAVTPNGTLHVIEVKGFPIIDGEADPVKVGAAARQSAVYLCSLHDTFTAHQLDPTAISPTIILVCPRNFGNQPVAAPINISREVRALRRQIRRRDHLTITVREPAGHTTADLIDAIPYRYTPSCLAGCDLARYCRGCAQHDNQPARLGGSAATLLAAVPTIDDAIRLLDEGWPVPAHLQPVADILRRAHHTWQAAQQHLGTHRHHQQLAATPDTDTGDRHPTLDL